jgi:hypothetical protein
MAGSWQHMTTKSGKLRNSESFCGMIENLGDAYEAAEECYGMTWFLANTLATGDSTEAPSRARVLEIILQAEANYQHGLRIGGVQRDR